MSLPRAPAEAAPPGGPGHEGGRGRPRALLALAAG
jgi:hypothetical protein